MTITELSPRERVVLDAIGESREGRRLAEIMSTIEEGGDLVLSEGLVFTILTRLVRECLIYRVEESVVSIDGKARTIGVYSRFGACP